VKRDAVAGVAGSRVEDVAGENEIESGVSRAIVDLARTAELALGPFDLTLTQYRVLAHLNRGQTIQTNLAFKLAVTRQNITRVVDVLVNRGLVERTKDAADRRRVLHSLTDEGGSVLTAADRSIHQYLMDVIGDLEDPRDEQIVLHALELVNSAVMKSFARIRPVVDVAEGEPIATRPPRRRHRN
jgi:DNA-binding MarR family transcriptional regulator